MEQQEYLDRIHSEILTVMDEVHRVCTENNLKYYLIGGTLLGAVRHKGFIPWDDDLDIVMPREDMEKLIAIADNQLASGFHLEWISTNPDYHCLFPKICLNNTIFDEGRNYNGHPLGIFVDIFPLDTTGAYRTELETIKQTLKRYNYISVCRKQNALQLKSKIYRFFGYFVSNRWCYKKQRETCLKSNLYGNSHYVNLGSQYSAQRQTMPMEWYGEGAFLEFDSHLYRCPKEYDKVLLSIFGSNYMELPPENKRRSHYPKMVRFSDGHEIHFETPKHRVTISDQF